MRFQYSTSDPAQDEFDSLPRIPLTLRYNNQQLDVLGLVDSGSTVSVLPHDIGYNLAHAGTTGKRTFGWLEILVNLQRCHSQSLQPLAILLRYNLFLPGSKPRMHP